MADRYFDHDDKARAELTREEVEDLLTYELMEQGVRRPKPPELLPEDAPEVPTVMVWGIEVPGAYRPEKLAVIFETAEAARAFLELGPGLKKGDWQLGDLEWSEAITGATVVSFELSDAQSVVNASSAKKQAEKNKEANQKAREEYQKGMRVVAEATESIWEDWAEQRKQLAKANTVLETWREYVETCKGDHDTASVFLRKVHSAGDIQLARDWLDADIPDAFDVLVAEASTLPAELEGGE